MWVTTGARAKKRKFWIAMQLLNDPDDNFPSEEENDNLNIPRWLDQLDSEELDWLSGLDSTQIDELMNMKK